MSCEAAGHGQGLRGLAVTKPLHTAQSTPCRFPPPSFCVRTTARDLSRRNGTVCSRNRACPTKSSYVTTLQATRPPALLEKLRVLAEARGVVVRITRNTQNLGYVANFEAALQDASGDVLFLCDQDDVWHPDKLVTLVAEFERRPGLLLLCSDARRIDMAGEGMRRSLFDVLKMSRRELQRIHAGEGFAVLLRRSLATGATVALRRPLLVDALPFPPGWVHDEWLAIIAAALRGFDCIEDALIDYRQYDDNQLGMPERGLAEKWRDLLTPQAVRIDALVARNEVLREWLRMLDGRLHRASLGQVDGNLAHLRARRALQGAVWRRTGTVLREAALGRYRRYATGWRSMLRDLLRRA